MNFQFTNKQELFNCINDLNQEYYKPADENFKMYEEYSRNNASFLLGLFRDAHDCLVKAIMVIDIVNRKNKIDYYLEKYVKTLLLILIHEYVGLITVRKDDLLDVPLVPYEKNKIEDLLKPKWDELRAFTSVKFTYNNNIDELTRAKNFYKNTYEFVESIYTKYNI